MNWLGRIVETNQWKLGPGHNTVPGTLNGQGAKMSNEERKTLPLGENRHVPGPGAYAVGGSSIDSSKGTVFNPQDGKTVEEHILEQAAQVPGPGQYDAEENPAVRGGHFRIFMELARRKDCIRGIRAWGGRVRHRQAKWTGESPF